MMINTYISLLLTFISRKMGADIPISISIPSRWNQADPFVSVIIPCYNHGEYLEEAVESILAQTWQNLEIIVVNDGSSDERTNQILKSFHKEKTRIIHLEHNAGLPAARNAGIAQARGKYICCLDADDKLQETYIEKAITLMEINAGISFVWAWTKVFGAEDRVWQAPQFDLQKILYYNLTNPPAVFRKSAWEKSGGFDESMRDGFEDWEFWIRMSGHGFRGHRISQKLFHIRRMGYSFANRAADNKEKLFELIKKKNAKLYEDVDATVAKIKQGYRDFYNPTPFLNLPLQAYRTSLPACNLFVANLNSKQTLQWLRTCPKDAPAIWVSQQSLDEESVDALYQWTPYVYILPDCVPQYARAEFIKHLQARSHAKLIRPQVA
ncbi:MAG: glycosyl transferase family protein [Chloroflexi bacterium OLB14]|nr:MAG: glycosyl transferase family protein [Chloroflexi bacterium OLB14]